MITELDFSLSRIPPYKHQREDTLEMVNHPFLFITSEMRTGKTKIVIDAAQFLFKLGLINRVIVVGPEPVRGVWFDPNTGQLKKHLWRETSAWVTEYHSDVRQWRWGPEPEGTNVLKFVVTNYEFLRPYTDKNQNVIDANLKGLLPYATPKTLLVLDESGAITNHKSEQYKSCYKIRKKCGRVVLLNGTPMDTPLHLFAQGNMLHESILECPYITHFKARHAIMGGFKVGAVRKKHADGSVSFEGGRPTQIIGWTNLEDLQRRFAPYTIRRLQKNCLDIPPKLEPVTIPVTMSQTSWRAYCDMRDEMVVMLEGGNASIAQQQITKIMRLAQITSGFLGGIADAGLSDDDAIPVANVREIGREKLDLVLWLTRTQIEKDPNLKIVVWVRFKPELDRMLAAVRKQFPQMIVAGISGGQKKAERKDALELLNPDTAPEGPVFFAGTFGTGSFGLDFSASHTNVNCSYDYSLRKFLQAGDRVYGPGQKHPVSYFDLVARGPKGQRTIDDIILTARRGKANISDWTTAAWVRALRDEDSPLNQIDLSA